MNQDLRQQMIDAVSEDSRRKPHEKETGINFAKPDERMQITTTENGLMRRLLMHPEFEIDWIVQSSNGSEITLEADEITEEFDGRRPVITVVGTLPIGCLSLRYAARTTGGHSNAVTSKVLEKWGEDDE